MQIARSRELLAGFHATVPDTAVPELRHAGEQWASSRLFIDHHAHEEWELYYQADGVSRWRAEKKAERAERVYELEPGGFFVAAPGVSHQMHERAQSKHHFFFAAVDLNVVFGRHPELAASWRGRDAVWTPRGESVHEPFRQLMREISLDSPHRSAALRLALDTLVIAATRLLEDANPISFLRVHPAALEARRMVEMNPGHPWRVEDLAAAGNLSPSHFAHIFTREMGVSPHKFILQARIDRAKSLLESSDLAITDIALECGFASLQHFATAFRASTGVTARNYRYRYQARQLAPPVLADIANELAEWGLSEGEAAV